jgi:hypothetical protein
MQAISCNTRIFDFENVGRDNTVYEFMIGAGKNQSILRRATGWTAEARVFSTVSRMALGPNQWIPGALSPGAQRPRREEDHSPLSSAEVKNGRAISPLPHTSSWSGA